MELDPRKERDKKRNGNGDGEEDAAYADGLNRAAKPPKRSDGNFGGGFLKGLNK